MFLQYKETILLNLQARFIILRDYVTKLLVAGEPMPGFGRQIIEMV